MSLVNILNIQVLDNPTGFHNEFKFEITFECNAELKDDLEWKMIYVGSAESPQYDQVLDSIMVGPIPVGVNKFIFSADAPKLELLPQRDLLEVTVVLLSCLYHDKEFVRIGYYVNNEYTDEELRENPPPQVLVDKLQRNILADKPKVTRYNIDWYGQGQTQDQNNEQETTQQPMDQDMMVQ
ncbi:histone chaperone [Halteromyces radiatus]|uniref:histone chaperone n=1 Tax=Halteromyces radiatus TaxID=101107 RepID=UPI0022210B14|nr:histone chaperone [Halteromyces radiatus]KAI8096779.1 histone chaperone [Halteromyces radiatus]